MGAFVASEEFLQSQVGLWQSIAHKRKEKGLAVSSFSSAANEREWPDRVDDADV